MDFKIIADIQKVMQKKGYAFFVNGDYNVNLIGVRTSRKVTNKFDDWIFTIYKIEDIWRVFSFPATTNAGTGPFKSPSNNKGVAVLKPGQYRGCYEIGFHKGKQKALIQCKPVTVYRDYNKDTNIDYVKQETGMFGINIHWSNLNGGSTQVDNWSEGCQVGTGGARDEWLSILESARTKYGNKFTYTLLELSDFGSL